MTDVTDDAMNPELLRAVKELVDAVRDFLHADDGCDDHRIVAMENGVHSVLTEARKTPALDKWADRIADN